MSTDPVLTARAALGVASRYTAKGAPDPDRVAAARRDLTAAKLERAIREAVASAPPLTSAQRDRLATLLTGAAK